MHYEHFEWRFNVLKQVETGWNNLECFELTPIRFQYVKLATCFCIVQPTLIYFNLLIHASIPSQNYSHSAPTLFNALIVHPKY